MYHFLSTMNYFLSFISSSVSPAVKSVPVRVNESIRESPGLTELISSALIIFEISLPISTLMIQVDKSFVTIFLIIFN